MQVGVGRRRTIETVELRSTGRLRAPAQALPLTRYQRVRDNTYRLKTARTFFITVLTQQSEERIVRFSGTATTIHTTHIFPMSKSVFGKRRFYWKAYGRRQGSLSLGNGKEGTCICLSLSKPTPHRAFSLYTLRYPLARMEMEWNGV